MTDHERRLQVSIAATPLEWVGKVGVPETTGINLGWGPVYRAVFERLWRAKDGKFGRLS